MPNYSYVTSYSSSYSNQNGQENYAERAYTASEDGQGRRGRIRRRRRGGIVNREETRTMSMDELGAIFDKPLDGWTGGGWPRLK